MPVLVNATNRPIWCGNDRLIPGQPGMIADTWMEHPRMQSLMESGAVKPSAEQLPTRADEARRQAPPPPPPPFNPPVQQRPARAEPKE